MPLYRLEITTSAKKKTRQAIEMAIIRTLWKGNKPDDESVYWGLTDTELQFSTHSLCEESYLSHTVDLLVDTIRSKFKLTVFDVRATLLKEITKR